MNVVRIVWSRTEVRKSEVRLIRGLDIETEEEVAG